MGANPNIFTNKENRRVVPPEEENFFVSAEEFKAIDTAFATKADQSSLDSLSGSVSGLSSQVTAIDGEVTSLQGEVTTLQTDLGTAETDITNLQSGKEDAANKAIDFTVVDNTKFPTTLAVENRVPEIIADEIIQYTEPIYNDVELNLLYHNNLALIDKFDERCEFNSRTRFNKLIHTEDIIQVSENVHLIPSYKSTSILPSVYPNLSTGDFTFTTTAGYTIVRPLDGVTPLFTLVSSDIREFYNPVTKRVDSIINEDDLDFNGLHSGDFTQTAWTTNSIGVSVETTSDQSPFTGINWFRIRETAVTDQHRIRQHLSSPNLGNAYPCWWLTCFVSKTGNNGRNVGLEFSTGGAARAIFDPLTGTFVRTDFADFVKVDVLELENSWYIGLCMSTASTSGVRGAVSLRVGDSTSNYLGDTGVFITVANANIIGYTDSSMGMPFPNVTSATAVTKLSDSYLLEDWVTNGLMGSYSGQVITEVGNDTIVEAWEGDQLTVTTNGVPASPVTLAIPTDYPMRFGRIKSVKIKKISDASPDLPVGFDFNISRGFATLYNSGAGVDGGGAATPIVITTKTQFEDNFSGSNKVLDIQANIDLDDIQYSFGSNITLKSTNGSRIQYGQWRFDTVSNVLIENIERRKSYNDLMNFKIVDGILIKHCKFDGEATVNVRTVPNSDSVDSQVFDGLLDFSNGSSNNITVMFSQFLNHNKVMIINLDSETDRTDITMAWNYFYNCYQRTPRAQMCDLDLVNNFFSQCRNMTDVGINANIKARGNYYLNSNKNWQFAEAVGGIIESTNNLYVNIDTLASERSPESVFTLPVAASYAITPLDNTADVPAFVLANSGNVLHTL